MTVLELTHKTIGGGGCFGLAPPVRLVGWVFRAVVLTWC